MAVSDSQSYSIIIQQHMLNVPCSNWAVTLGQQSTAVQLDDVPAVILLTLLSLIIFHHMVLPKLNGRHLCIDSFRYMTV